MYIQSIDPILLNERKINSSFSFSHLFVSQHLERIPTNTPSHIIQNTSNHLYTKYITEAITGDPSNVCTLTEYLAKTKKMEGEFIYSTEKILRSTISSRNERVIHTISPKIETEYKVLLSYDSSMIISDTGLCYLSDVDKEYCLVAKVEFIDSSSKIIHLRPLLIGLEAKRLDLHNNKDLLWGYFYKDQKIMPEEIEEFSRMVEVPLDEDWSVMRTIDEKAVKKAFANGIFNLEPEKDWGGENSDLYTRVTIGGERLQASFLLKGPAGGSKFRAMTPAHLGKNSDQIGRIASEDNELLVVQHCHEISSSVSLQLQAFASRPWQPKRYCLITGQDTYRILKAYNLLEEIVS